MLKVDSDNPVVVNQLAWFLVTNRDPDTWNAERAASLARKAIEKRDDQAFNWYTLGVAEYRAGDWETAAEAFEKATELRNDDPRGFAGFFIAMNQWQLNRKTAARRSYLDAVKWMSKQNPKDIDLNRFRGEAADLLEFQSTQSLRED